MKTKIKRHSRSVLSVVLALCMLLSCMTAGMIMTDAAKVDSESVSWNPTTDKFRYQVNNGGWTDLSFNSNGVTTFTVSNDNSTLEFKLVFNGTVYNHNSSQSTFSAVGMHSKDGETRLAKTGGSDYSVSGVYADTYTVKLTTTVNNGEVNFKINGTYVKQASSWTVVGDSEELFGGTWNTTNTANDLDMTQTPHTWTKNAVYLSAGDIEYKVVKDYAWAGCYPAAGNRKTTVSSSGYYNVTVTYDGNTDLKMTLDPAAKCTLTVPQIADATVTATYGSQTAAEGQSLTEVPAGADITVNVTPDSGHKCTGVSAGSSTATGSGTNWTLKMPNSDATLSATIAAYTAPMRTIYFYNKFTQYPMVTIYAYYKDGSGNITDEIFGTGKTMTKLPNSDIWTIDVPEDAYVKFMGEGKNTGELQPVDNHPAAPKYVPGPDRDNPGNGGNWGEYIERNNVYSVNEGDNMSSSNLFTGITATFFDYYVDNEVTGGWLTGITAESDYKCSGYTNDPYRNYLNAALSNYADNTNEPKNNITYPLYWGNNKNINGDDSNAIANVHSGDLFNFYLSVNNSAKLNPPSTAMQGLAGNSLAGGNIHHYKAGAADNNGAAMAFFDEDFLSGENSQSKALATILHSPKFPVRKDAASRTLYLDTSANTGWENDNAVMRAVFFNSATDEAGRHIVQAAKVADHLYAVAVPSDYAKVQWWRGDPNDVGTRWNYGNDVSIPADNKIVCKIKNGAFDNNDEWVASSSTTTTHTYYEYDSTNGKDNAYITDINTTEKTANLSYYDQASGKYVQSQNNIKGFFPFDYNNVVAADTYPTDTIYVDVSSVSGANYYGAYLFKTGQTGTWITLTQHSEDTYKFDNSAGYDAVILTRGDTEAKAKSFDQCWNRTDDVTIPNGTSNQTTIKLEYDASQFNGKGMKWSHQETSGLQPVQGNNFADPTGRLAHDQGFGMKLEIPFTLNKYGVNKDGSPQTFDFSGDDDLWVYIDDKLVLDLGGAHGRTTGTINFNSMQAVADTAAAVTTGTDQVDGGIRSYDFSSIINTAANDFNHNQIHTMTIYYMERGMFDSNLRFGFSFSAVDTLFSAEKKIRTRSLNSGFFVDNGLTGDESNMSDLKLDKGVRQVTKFEKSFQSDQFEITQTYVGPLPDGHTDITYSIGADSTTIPNATSPISYTLQNTDQTEKRAYFNGQFASGDTFTMKETAKDGNKYNYTPSIIVYDEAKKLSNGNPTPFATVANATSRGQVSGNNTDGYKFLFQPINAPAAGGLEDLRIRARFENDMKQHALTIKKTVSDPADTTTEFIFEIQFDFTDDNNYVGYPLVINGHSDTTLSPEGRVTIKAGQSITLYGIPEKAKVQVTEVTPNAPYVYDSTTVKTDGGDDVEKTPVKTPVVSGVRFVMGTANTIVTTKNSKGEPVHITHTLHPDSTGRADCYVSATVQDADGNVQSGGNFEQTDAMITVPAEFIKYDSDNKLVIVLNTVPEDHSNFTNFYEKITDEMKTLAASGILYSAEIDLPNRTATITIEIKKLFDKNTHKQLYKTLPFYSKLDLIADNFTISKKILDNMTSSETYNINIKTKAEFTTSATATPYKGPYVIKHTDGTTDSVASDDTRTECKVELHPNDEIKIGVVTDTNFEITEEALSSDYQRMFHYVSTTVDNNKTFSKASDATDDVKVVDNGVLVKVTSANKRVDINNKAWGYMIEYTYPGYLKRYNTVNQTLDQKYYVSGLFSEADYVDKVELAEVADNSNNNVAVQGVRFKSDEIQKNFITSHAPYENNFMTDLTWNPIFEGETGSNTTRFFYANNTGEEVNMKPNAVVTANKQCQVYFRLPFAYNSSNGGNIATPSQDDGGKILKTETQQMNVQAPYGKWYTLNNEYTEAEAEFVTAPREIYEKKGDGSYDKYVFRHWSMKTTPTGHNRRTTEEYKRCYYWDFNMTFYQDTIVEPVYALAGTEGTDLTPAQLETLDTTNGGGTNITFLENSRNQWNRNGGNNQEIPSREKQGDRVYSDFLLSFSWNDIMLRTALSKKITEIVGEGEQAEEVTSFVPYLVNDDELHYSGGLVIEKVAAAPDITNTSDIKTQDEYRQQYGYNNDLVTAATNYINSGNTNGGNFLLNETFSAAGFDNKNQFEYSTSFANKRHTDLSDTPYKGYVYRAYTYLRDYDGSAATTANCTIGGDDNATEAEVNAIRKHHGELLKVSKPVYFTIYEMATIENGTTYTGQGES